MRKTATILDKITRKYKDKKYTYWVARYKDCDGCDKSKTLGKYPLVTKKEAIRLQIDFEKKLRRNPSFGDAGRVPTLHDYLEAYYDHRKTELSPGTLDLHRQTGRYLKACFGKNRRIDTITRSMARQFKTKLANDKLNFCNKKQYKNKAPATIELAVRNSAVLFKPALEDGIIEINPFDKLAKYTKTNKQWHFVTQEEYQKMLDQATPGLGLLISLCRLAALRLGEALNLEWSDIDWAKNRITINVKKDWQPKDRDSRVIPCCPELMEQITTVRLSSLEIFISQISSGCCNKK